MEKFLTKKIGQSLALAAFALAPGLAIAFDSGSTGADGAFSPTVNTQLELPPSGIFNFTTINIPAGVTLTFKKNATNTPVVMLASGNVTIAGTINLSGGGSTNSGAAGDGNLGDDGIPGSGGPGGYSGGTGGGVSQAGGSGLGPGGGQYGSFGSCSVYGTTVYAGGGGGGFSGAGAGPVSYASNCPGIGGGGGPTYGTTALLPLVGGSGGGGGAGGGAFAGTGGGGGGGALLIASSATVSLSGTILAVGGNSGTSSGVQSGASGGGGSGGAIRIVATTISGNGTITATGGAAGGASQTYVSTGGNGSDGRIRLEATTFQRTAATTPAYVFASPGPVFVAGMPTLKISSVAGVSVPDAPTGNADVTLPSTTANPVAITFNTTGVPVGNTVKLTLKPANGAVITAVSPALTGSTDSATASVSVNLPSGPSTLEATTTYTIVVAMGEALSQYARGERVEKITLASTLGGTSRVTLITVSGKEYDVPAAVLAAMPG